MAESDGRIPQEILDDITARLDIVDVIGRYVPLKKSGSNYTGLCPFHNEKTPSFSVSPSKQIFHCFGCGAGGNLFRFIMDIEQLSFPEAARKLAREAGVTIPERRRSAAEQAAFEKRRRLFQINALASQYYQQVLHNKAGAAYRAYLAQRGVNDEVVLRFGLGASMASWDGLVRFFQQKGVPLDEAATLGLVSQGQHGYYDRFRERLMFPIRDEQGRTIGFGGRIMRADQAPQKYLNSQETPLFHKGSVLFGLDLARKAIREEDRVIIVEGYMDVIACHQAGINNVVAPLGTALTEEQVKRLLRHTYHFVTAFDGDQAGKRATLRSLEIIERFGGHLRVLAFPGGQDPDDYLKQNGRDGFLHLLEQAQEGFAFRLESYLNEHAQHTIEDRLAVLDKMLVHLAQVRNSAVQEHMVTSIAERLQMSTQAVYDELHRYRRYGQSKRTAAVATTPEPPQKVQQARVTPAFHRESTLLALLFDKPERFATIEEKGGASLFFSEAGQLYALIAKHLGTHHTLNAGDIDPTYTPLLAQALSEAEDSSGQNTEELFGYTLQQMEMTALNQQYRAQLAQLEVLEKSADGQALQEALLVLEELLQKKTLLERSMGKGQ